MAVNDKGDITAGTRFTVFLAAPEKRKGAHDGEGEEHFPEASVMVAFALHLLQRDAQRVELHPDGMHARQHDIEAQLKAAGFRFTAGTERGSCVGQYVRDRKSVV